MAVLVTSKPDNQVILTSMTHFTHFIRVHGIVQGVGFRPFVFNLATNYGLLGWVRNSSSGVDIVVTGPPDRFKAFLSDINNCAPPLAQIESIDVQTIDPIDFEMFSIIHSEENSGDFLPVSPDIAVCKDCHHELFNPKDRRYRYPFINCTNCGPRFSIIRDIPYDRLNTTMSEFELCVDCQAEFNNPHDRRFHAQPVACAICGPRVWLELTPGEQVCEGESAIQEARHLIKEGKILAIKGLGGFHLVCDATSAVSVARLRARKQRKAKPFALMAYDLQTISHYVELSASAEAFLSGPQAPILLLPAKPQKDLADNISPGNSKLGFMLPYTPLHLLLMEPENDFPKVLVMTSGNLSEEPVIHEDQVARNKLAGIADAFLLHNRPIYRRIDDSVFAMVGDQPYPIRRARGFAPNPIHLSESIPQILAVGAQMKNTFCLTRDNYAFISHYVGEMENWETFQDYQQAINDYEQLFRINPVGCGFDLHPDYVTTQYAKQRIKRGNLHPYPIQHHHAHLAALIIEHGLNPQQDIAGLIFDGTGYSSDQTIWGGEVLVGNCLDFSRMYSLKPVPLPGGDISIIKPSRMALSTLWAYNIPWHEHLAPVQALSEQEKTILLTQLEKAINAPLTSSMGRLFDAVSALLGIRMKISYEAQAAIELEALADDGEMGYYPWRIDGSLIHMKTTLEAILNDLNQAISLPIISARFHNTIAQISLEVAFQIKKAKGITQIALSGGVWQNLFLLNKTLTLLTQAGFNPLIHRVTPPNDECIALGQAAIAAYRHLNNKE